MRLTELRCDRCGIRMDNVEGVGQFIAVTAPTANGIRMLVEWCRDCVQSYRKWLKEEQ